MRAYCRKANLISLGDVWVSCNDLGGRMVEERKS